MAQGTGAETAREAGVRWRGGGLGRRVEGAEAAVFQGRQAELAAVLARMDAPDRLPGVVSLTGPPGIGKTAFVYALGRACRDRGMADVAIIDSCDFSHTLPGLLDAVRAVSAGAIRSRISGSHARPLLLVFDTFEEMRDLEEELWQTVSAELRWRAPERYTRLRRRAAEHLLACPADADRGHAVPELLHLVGETVGPRRFFATPATAACPRCGSPPSPTGMSVRLRFPAATC